MKLTPLIVLLLLTGCSISLNNIASNGKAVDMLDEKQDLQADVKLKVDLPI